MSTGVVTWSQTAASNATADTSVNWAEGQAPSTVNDSARALMASVAKFRDDINGSITTGGTATAYTVASSQSFAALTAGYMIAFNPHATNTGTCTVNVDGLGGKPLRPAAGVEFPAGSVVLGTPYVATYFASNGGEWLVHGNGFATYAMPIGGIIQYVGSTAPNSNFILPAGQAISRTTFALLFAKCSTTFGAGDGSTTFNVPDFRGRVPVIWDALGGTSANRVTSGVSGIDGSTVGAVGGEQAHTLLQAELPNVTVGLNANNINLGVINVVPPAGSLVNNTVSTNNVALGGGATVPTTSSTVTATVTIPPFTPTGSTAALGSGGGHNNMPPSIVIPCIMRAL